MKIALSRTGNFLLSKEACINLGITLLPGSGYPDFYAWSKRKGYEPREEKWRADETLIEEIEKGEADYYVGEHNVSQLAVVDIPSSDILRNNWKVIYKDHYGEIVDLY